MKKGGGGIIVLTRKDLTVKNVGLSGDVGEAPNKRSAGRYPIETGFDIHKRSTQLRQGIEHKWPLGKSDPELLKFCLDVGLSVENGDGYKEEHLNYARVRYDDLRRYFVNVDWSAMYQEVSIQ
ncbi:hypothetical protein E2C01_046907 [Portunus trituberculatus]|uniref:Uncharacterized protein n=1 Tax=Portunus trituberculatus TaxID=210409 RepID=A0A5B7G6Z1_PORTR|nr:hypothetical protein [Portunus trituberculatus]